MPLKNYTTTVPASKSFLEITTALVRVGAVGILSEYDEKQRVSMLAFRLPIDGQVTSFSLPIDWRRFQTVLRKERQKVWQNEDRVYNIAVRCVRDWVLAQLALHQTQMVDLAQVFLPYATSANGTTLYDIIRQSPRLLSAPTEPDVAGVLT